MSPKDRIEMPRCICGCGGVYVWHCGKPVHQPPTSGTPQYCVSLVINVQSVTVVSMRGREIAAQETPQ